MADEKCVVCRRREPTSGVVCDPDLLAADLLLDDLPRKLRRLPLMLVPGQSPAGDRVAVTRVGSPTPAWLDALSLVGPGSVPVPGLLHPLVRLWSTTRDVQVRTRTGTHTTTVTDWHREAVTDQTTGEPVMVPDDDQAGILPPAEWLGQQVRQWRAVFGHHRPQPIPAVPGRPRPELGGPALAWMVAHLPARLVVQAWMVDCLSRAYRQGVADLVAGHEPGHGGNRPAGVREDDPVADLWEIRFGETTPPGDSLAHIAYLRTWLPQATRQPRDGVDVAAFFAELRSLSAELTRVLGEKPDNQWLGRCPADITDPDTGTTSVCGAGLWQDPHASVVECPRCHSAWGPRMVDLVHLAADIRRRWPLDRRRRYNAVEIDALRPIRCPQCGDDIEIGWQEVTGLGDKHRWWRPTRTRCPNGCEHAREIL